MAAVPLWFSRRLRRGPASRVSREAASSESWRWVWAGLTSIILATAAIAFPGLVRGISQGMGFALPSILRESAEFIVMTGFLLLCTATFLAYWWPRRSQARPFALVTGFVASAIAVVMGVVTYGRCLEDPAAPYTSIFHTMTLFVGGGYDPTDPSGTCSTMPIALQIARIVALGVALGALVAVMLRLFTEQKDRLYARFVTRLVIVTGLNDEAEPFIRELIKAHDGTARAKAWRSFPDKVVRDRVKAWIDEDGIQNAHIVLVHPDRTHPLIPGLRQAGVKLLVGQPDQVDRLGITKASKRVKAVYVLGTDSDENVRIATAARTMLTPKPAPDGSIPVEMLIPVKILVRIDDPRVAEERRRQSMSYSSRTVIEDTFGPQQTTAQEITAMIHAQAPEVLVLLGATTFTTTLLDELAQATREQRALSADLALTPTRIVLVDPDANSVIKDHESRQSWYDNDPLRVATVGSQVTESALEELVGITEVSRPFFVDCRDESPHSTLLAHRCQQLWELGTTLYPEKRAHGVERDDGAPGLHKYAPALLYRGHIPTDRWTRAARIMHENYIAAYGLDLKSQGSLPWVLLSDFYQMSNVRALTHLVQQVTALPTHRVWRPTFAEQDPSPPTPGEIEKLVTSEHDDWFEYYRRHGWQHGCTRVETERKKHHPKLLTWTELEGGGRGCSDPPTIESIREQTRNTVKAALNLLATLGYRPYLADPGSGFVKLADKRPVRYARTHDDTEPMAFFSAPLEHDEEWTSSGGTEMTAAKGDSWTAATFEDLTQQRNRWSVRKIDRNRTYLKVGDIKVDERKPIENSEDERREHTFVEARRTSYVMARRASPGERVVTSEGLDVAGDDQWLVRDDYGKKWLIPDERFQRTHQRVAGETPESPVDETSEQP